MGDEIQKLILETEGRRDVEALTIALADETDVLANLGDGYDVLERRVASMGPRL